MRKTLDVFVKGKTCFTFIQEILTDGSAVYNIGISVSGTNFNNKVETMYDELNFRDEKTAVDCFMSLKAAM